MSQAETSGFPSASTSS